MPDELPSASAFAAPQASPYRHCANIRESETTDRHSGETRHFLRTESRELFVLGEKDYFIWKALDGSQSLIEVEDAFLVRFGFRLGEQDLSRFINDLLRLGLIEMMSNDAIDAGDDRREGSADRPLMETPASASGATPLESGAVRYPSHLGWRTRFKEPFTVVLGDPDKLFRFLAAIFWPVRWLAWLLIPFTFLSCLIVLKHITDFDHDWRAVLFNIWWWPTLYVAEHIQNALTRVVEGVVITGFGGAVHQYRVRNGLGFLLRSYIDDSSLETMPMRCRLLARGSTLLLRLTAFNVGTWVWIYCRATYPAIADIGLFWSVLGFISFLITSCPLLPQEGYFVLATYLGQPDLKNRAWRYLGLRLRGRPAPLAMTGSERWSFVFFGVAIALVMIVWLGRIWIEIDVDAVRSMGGFGAIIVLEVFAVAGFYIYALRKFVRKMRTLYGGAMSGGAMRGGQRPPAKDSRFGDPRRAGWTSTTQVGIGQAQPSPPAPRDPDTPRFVQ